jgi:hypothetical protein
MTTLQSEQQQQQQPITTVVNLRKGAGPIGREYTTIGEWLRNPQHVYIGRAIGSIAGSKYGNPFAISKYAVDPMIERQRVVAQYRRHLVTSGLIEQARRELHGKVLGCWCAPEQCHGHVIAELIDASE